MRREATKASIAAAPTALPGTSGRTTGCQAQWSSRGSRHVPSGHAAPASIHAPTSSISSAERAFPRGGIRRSGSVEVTRSWSALVPRLPATTTAAVSSGLRGSRSRRSPPSWESGPWHSRQRLEKRARTCSATALPSPCPAPPGSAALLPAIAELAAMAARSRIRATARGWGERGMGAGCHFASGLTRMLRKWTSSPWPRKPMWPLVRLRPG